MGTVSDEVVRHLEPLVGLRLSVARRAADLRNFQFGQMREVEGGTVGDYALHIQCPWRIEGPGGILTGRSDLWEPAVPWETIDPETWKYEDGNLQDLRIQAFLGGFDPMTKSATNRGSLLVVERVHGDDCGGARLELSGGYHLVLFPAGTEGEDWRIFRPSTDEPHFVVSGGRVRAGSSGAA